MQKRNIGLCIVLTIITCGIYGIYWFIKLVDELNELAGDNDSQSGGIVFLLSIVTCSIYLLFWMYKAGEKVNKAKAKKGLPVDSNAGILYLLLTFFGLSIVSYALIQNEINNLID